jgi:hypothetical protein
MPKRIAVVATKAKFKEMGKFFRKISPCSLGTVTDDYMAIMDLYFYRIDKPQNNFMDAYQWSGYIDLVGFEARALDDWSFIFMDLTKCLDVLENKGVRAWNTSKVCREIEDLALPF